MLLPEEGPRHDRRNGYCRAVRPAQPQGSDCRGDRQYPGMVRLRRLRLSRLDDFRAVFPLERQARVAADDLPGFRDRLRDAAGRLDRVRHLRRPPWPAQGAQRRHLPDGDLDLRDRPPADLPAGRRAGADPSRRLPAGAGPLGRRRVGRIDRLYRRICARGTARLHRLVAAVQRRRRISARIALRHGHELHAVAGDARLRRLAGAVPPRHSASARSAPTCAGGLPIRPNSPRSRNIMRSRRRRSARRSRHIRARPSRRSVSRCTTRSPTTSR